MGEYAEKLTTGYYVVKLGEETLGRFRILTKAKALADGNPGSSVYAPDGAVIYNTQPTVDDEKVEMEMDATETDEAGTLTGSSVATVETAGNPGEEVIDETDKIGSGSSESFPEGFGDDADEQTFDNEPTPESTVAYAKLKLLMNIRTAPNLTADKVTGYRKGVICEVLEVCENDWLKIRCPESATGTAYVSNDGGQFAHIGKSVYKTVAGDSLRAIAEKELGNAALYMQIRELNGLTSNTVMPNTVLLMP